jgi:hypothetical protein
MVIAIGRPIAEQAELYIDGHANKKHQRNHDKRNIDKREQVCSKILLQVSEMSLQRRVTQVLLVLHDARRTVLPNKTRVLGHLPYL